MSLHEPRSETGRRTSRRDALRLAMGASAVLLLDACGPSASPPNAPPPSAATQAPAAPAATPAPATSATQAAAPTPTAAAAQAGKPGGTLRAGLDVDADTLDPRLTKNTSGYRVKELAFNGLVSISPDYSPAPDLATSWDNPDQKTWVFHLRPGVTFHDGSSLTSADVKYTYESVLDPSFNSPARSFYLAIQDIAATDPNTVTFTLNAPFAPFLSYMDLGIVPQAT